MSSEGYLMIDHRSSPGFGSHLRRLFGVREGSKEGGEGTVLERATMTCKHCATVQVKNPWRIRSRHHCDKCGGAYICDGCAAAAIDPLYVHRSFQEIADLVRSGRYTLSGSASAPILTPINEVIHHG